MLNTWQRLARLCLGLSVIAACSSESRWDGPTSGPEREREVASSDPPAPGNTQATAPNSPGAAVQDDRGCGDRLYYTAPWAFEVHLPELGIQAKWELEREREAGTGETALQGTFVYRGAERDDKALRCGLNEPCVAGGSRLSLGGSSGEIALHLHLAPNELPAIAEGSQVVLDTAPGSGELTLTDLNGTLLVGLVRPGAFSNHPAVRSYKLGAFDISKGPAVCFATQDMCNYRLTVHQIVVTRGAERWQLAPGERVKAQLDSHSYQIENHFAAQHGMAKPDRETCAAGQTEFDSISIVRTP